MERTAAAEVIISMFTVIVLENPHTLSLKPKYTEIMTSDSSVYQLSHQSQMLALYLHVTGMLNLYVLDASYQHFFSWVRQLPRERPLSQTVFRHLQV